MNRRKFLKALAALPVVGLLAKQTATEDMGWEGAGFDETVEEIKGPSWASAPTVTMPARDNDWYLLNDGLESIDLDSKQLVEPTGVRTDDIINLEVDFGDRMLRAGPLCVASTAVDMDVVGGYGESLRLVPVRGTATIASRTLVLNRQQGDWSVTVLQGMPQMWVTPFHEPEWLRDWTVEVENV